MEYRLLAEFRQLFEGRPYRHRRSTQGDQVAVQLYEDLLVLGRSSKFVERVKAGQRVVNLQNRRVGIRARRGDGSFGEIIPNEEALPAAGYSVGRGRIATLEIGTEVKVLAKAMIKQIDRVIGDVERQVAQFKLRGGQPITVAILGVNWAERTTGYERGRRYRTDGKQNPHPVQEAADAEARLMRDLEPLVEHLLLLRYKAENVRPFRFEWVNYSRIEAEYGAVLTRISRDYDRRY